MSPLPLSVRLRAWAWAAAVRPLKHVVPLQWLVRLAHARPVHPRSEPLERALEQFLGAGGRFPRRAPGNCLERSLGAYRLLCRSSAAPELVVGFRRAATGQFEGHVWVTVDGRALAEPPQSLAGYAAIVRFDAAARRHDIGDGGDLAGLRLD